MKIIKKVVIIATMLVILTLTFASCIEKQTVFIWSAFLDIICAIVIVV